MPEGSKAPGMTGTPRAPETPETPETPEARDAGCPRAQGRTRRGARRQMPRRASCAEAQQAVRHETGTVSPLSRFPFGQCTASYENGETLRGDGVAFVSPLESLFQGPAAYFPGAIVNRSTLRAFVAVKSARCAASIFLVSVRERDRRDTVPCYLRPFLRLADLADLVSGRGSDPADPNMLSTPRCEHAQIETRIARSARARRLIDAGITRP